MAAYRRMDDYHDIWSRAGWLPVHRDQFRAQRSVTSMGSLYLFTIIAQLVVDFSQFRAMAHVPGEVVWGYKVHTTIHYQAAEWCLNWRIYFPLQSVANLPQQGYKLKQKNWPLGKCNTGSLPRRGFNCTLGTCQKHQAGCNINYLLLHEKRELLRVGVLSRSWVRPRTF